MLVLLLGCETNCREGRFLPPMDHQKITIEAPHGFDFKAAGYLVSIVSVFFLGAIAWPKPDEPKWHLPALIAGMALSIAGMGLRYLAHLRQKREIREAQQKAKKR
jgi:hypothetical protein